MGYRELSRMHVREVVRRWQAQESQRAIARAMGLSRVTVRRYITEAQSLALAQTGPPQSWGTAHWTVWPTPHIRSSSKVPATERASPRNGGIRSANLPTSSASSHPVDYRW